MNLDNVSSLVADSPVDGETSVDRQILQAAETDLAATLPRNGQFPVYPVYFRVYFNAFL